MKNGQVVEMGLFECCPRQRVIVKLLPALGTHSELVAKRGFYYALTKKQNVQ